VRVVVTGATGLIGGALVHELQARGDEVTVLTRDEEHAAAALPGAVVYGWLRPTREPAPAEAFAGRDAVVHLAGEPIAQRWTDDAKQRIRTSRELGTRNLVAGLRAAEEPRPRVLVSQSAIGWYGARGNSIAQTTPRAGRCGSPANTRAPRGTTTRRPTAACTWPRRPSRPSPRRWRPSAGAAR